MFYVGNICRSPIAEAVFVSCLKQSGKSSSWTVDSAAIGNWHVGNGPDRRAVSVLSKHGITTDHRARQVYNQIYRHYCWIVFIFVDLMNLWFDRWRNQISRSLIIFLEWITRISKTSNQWNLYSHLPKLSCLEVMIPMANWS